MVMNNVGVRPLAWDCGCESPPEKWMFVVK